ncbi:MAG TPA: hypothetical protein VGQ83_15375 [Polyangia bacterium]|jgi:hypothetical protein
MGAAHKRRIAASLAARRRPVHGGQVVRMWDEPADVSPRVRGEEFEVRAVESPRDVRPAPPRAAGPSLFPGAALSSDRTGGAVAGEIEVPPALAALAPVPAADDPLGAASPSVALVKRADLQIYAWPTGPNALSLETVLGLDAPAASAPQVEIRDVGYAFRPTPRSVQIRRVLLLTLAAALGVAGAGVERELRHDEALSRAVAEQIRAPAPAPAVAPALAAPVGETCSAPEAIPARPAPPAARAADAPAPARPAARPARPKPAAETTPAPATTAPRAAPAPATTTPPAAPTAATTVAATPAKAAPPAPTEPPAATTSSSTPLDPTLKQPSWMSR